MVGPSDLIGARYRLGERIADREGASLYRARDEVEGRDVVVELLDDPPVEEAFPSRDRRDDRVPVRNEDILRRARAVAALTHPGIAPVRDAGTHDGRPYVVTEPVDGRSLATVARTESVSLEQALSWGAAILDALNHAHQAGVAHGDLRAGRVIISRQNRPTITGWAELRPYDAPDPHEDLLRAAEIVHELAAGNSDDPIPPDLQDVLLKATSPDPGFRFRSASEMASALRSVPVETEPVASSETAQEDPSLAPVWPIPGRRYDPTKLGRRVITIAVALALIALTAFFLRVASRLSDEDRPQPPSPPPTLQSPTAQHAEPQQVEERLQRSGVRPGSTLVIRFG